MVFSSPVFLFLFLPAVLLLSALPGLRWRNGVLLAASLAFYAWGEGELLLLLLGSIALNYALGRACAALRGRDERGARAVAVAAVVLNLAILALYKYAGWLVGSLAQAFGSGPAPRALEGLRLPLGISFFTFQAMSYVLDVHAGRARAERSPLRFALYISFFPQLIAGPIVRYRDVASQLASRVVDLEGLAAGARRFTVGLGKKLLVADVLAQVAEPLFARDAALLTPAAAWLGTFAFGLQVYFDFSGYTDMALGIARMFGIRLRENFQHPYVSRSFGEFWRRWHISLSTWFRDYLYIPLGGSRRGAARNTFNLLFTFALIGLWHGASWTYLAFGAIHGGFVLVERLGLRALLERAPRALGHLWYVVAMLFSYAIFRSDSLERGVQHCGAMLGLVQHGPVAVSATELLDPRVALTLLTALVGSLPWLPRARAWYERRAARSDGRGAALALESLAHVGLALVLALALMQVAAGTYNPFLYFRF